MAENVTVRLAEVVAMEGEIREARPMGVRKESLAPYRPIEVDEMNAESGRGKVQPTPTPRKGSP